MLPSSSQIVPDSNVPLLPSL